MPVLEFGETLEVEALLRASLAFKFETGEQADLYVGSPYYARSLHGLLEAVMAGYREAGRFGHADRWWNSLRLSEHRERWDFVVSYARRHPKWESMSEEECGDWVRVVASPYRVTEEEIRQLRE